MRPDCCELGKGKYDQLEIFKSCIILLYITFNREQKRLQKTC